MTSYRRILAGLLFMVGASSGALVPRGTLEAQTPAATATSLYGRLGGYDFLTRFVDTAFPRVASDSLLSRLFRGHSVDSQMRQRQLIVDALCQAAGGPCFYIGRDLRLVHDGLHISAQDWRAFMKIIHTTVQEFRLTEEVQRDFLKLFEGFRPVVVRE